MLAGGTSEPSQGFWAYLGPPWGHPWGSGLVPRSMGGQQKNTNFHFFSTFKLTKTSILPNCQVSNGNFLLVENYNNFNISELLGDLDRHVSPIWKARGKAWILLAKLRLENSPIQNIKAGYHTIWGQYIWFLKKNLDFLFSLCCGPFHWQGEAFKS